MRITDELQITQFCPSGSQTLYSHDQLFLFLQVTKQQFLVSRDLSDFFFL